MQFCRVFQKFLLRKSAGEDIKSGMASPRFKLPGMAALSALEAAARLGSFTRAAEELNTSQPAISRHVRDLEERLGASLFRRQPGGLVPTEAGRKLYRAVHSGLGEISDTIAVIREQERQRKRTVSIACSYDNAHLIVMPRYAELVDAIGGADLRVQAVEFEHIRDLQDENFDIILSGGPPPDPRDNAERLWREEVVPVAHPDFWRRHGKPETAEDFLDLPLLELSKRNFGWLDWAGWLARSGSASTTLAVAQHYPNYVFVLEAAAAGKGVALGFAGYYSEYVRLGRLEPASVSPVRTDGGCFAVIDQGSPAKELVNKLLSCLVA